MHNELVQGIRELYKVDLGINEEERLLRAQGAMYMFMRNNLALKEMLRYEYENKQESLPFILVVEQEVSHRQSASKTD